MNVKDDPFHEIETILTQLRQQAKTRQRFPQEVWNTVIRLTQTHPIQEVSLRLNISPTYLNLYNQAKSRPLSRSTFFVSKSYSDFYSYS